MVDDFKHTILRDHISHTKFRHDKLDKRKSKIYLINKQIEVCANKPKWVLRIDMPNVANNIL
jgi:hypothetical protein